MGFGFAALIAGPLMQYLVAHVGLVNNFIILGITYLIVMSATSLYLKAPTPKEPTRSNQDKSTMYVHNHGMLANDAMFSMVVVALHGPLSLISLGEHKLIYYSLSWKSLPSIYCPKPIVH